VLLADGVPGLVLEGDEGKVVAIVEGEKAGDCVDGADVGVDNAVVCGHDIVCEEKDGVEAGDFECSFVDVDQVGGVCGGKEEDVGIVVVCGGAGPKGRCLDVFAHVDRGGCPLWRCGMGDDGADVGRQGAHLEGAGRCEEERVCRGWDGLRNCARCVCGHDPVVRGCFDECAVWGIHGCDFV